MWKKMWQKLASKWKLLAIGLGPVVFLLLIFSFVPMKQVPYEFEETYQTTETYYVPEAYTVPEPYTVIEPYTEIEIQCDEEPCEQYIPIDYLVVGGQGYNYYNSDDCGVELYIKNADEVSGLFTVEFQLVLLDDVTTTVTVSEYIEAGKTEKILAYYADGRLKTLYSYSYSISAPTKLNPTYKEVEVTKEREVTKYDEVTRYRYVPQEMTVLKTRTVTGYKRVSLLDYLVNY